MDPKQMAEYSLTVEEAAQIVGVSTARIRQFIGQNRLQAIMRGGSYFLKPDEVKAFRPKPRGRPAKQ